MCTGHHTYAKTESEYGSAYSPASAHITYSQTYYTPRTLHYLAVRYIREVLHTVTPSYPACSRRHICHSAFAQFFGEREALGSSHSWR